MLPDTLTDNYKAYIDKYCKENDVVVIFRRVTTSETGIAHGEEPIHGDSYVNYIEVSRKYTDESKGDSEKVIYNSDPVRYDTEITSFASAIHWLEGGIAMKYIKTREKEIEQMKKEREAEENK